MARLLACSRARLGFFLLSTVSPAFSHENHVGTKHSAWLVPVQLVAIERSADSSRTEKEEKVGWRKKEELSGHSSGVADADKLMATMNLRD